MVRQKLDVIGRMGVRGSQCSGDPIFLYFFIKENWICDMTKHHAEPNINILLTRNLPFDSDVVISLECLWTKQNNRTRGQFGYGVTWFWFCFDFVRSHARYHLERGLCLKLDVQSQGWTGDKNFKRRMDRGRHMYIIRYYQDIAIFALFSNFVKTLNSLVTNKWSRIISECKK